MLFHTALSLIAHRDWPGRACADCIRNNALNGWTLWFLVTTVATTLTGFLFPFRGFTPAIGTGIVSTWCSRPRSRRATRSTRRSLARIYVIGAVISLYLNCFVLVVQAFLKVPALHALAPEGKEPPFAITQAIVLVLSVVSGFLAVRRFRPVAAQAVLATTADKSACGRRES